jgi:Domain of unknown function (DUF4398)
MFRQGFRNIYIAFGFNRGRGTLLAPTTQYQQHTIQGEDAMNARFATASAVLILALPFSAANATDRKDAELAMTEAGTAVESAERADAMQYAAVDMTDAHNMLASAQAAYDHHKWLDSLFDSGNAKADANLAAERARQHRAEAATTEIESSVRSLREQLGITGEQP